MGVPIPVRRAGPGQVGAGVPGLPGTRMSRLSVRASADGLGAEMLDDRGKAPLLTEDLHLPVGRRCIIKGYETLGMVGTPPAWVESEEEQGRKPTLAQAGWQVRLSFIALLVVAPEGLRILKSR